MNILKRNINILGLVAAITLSITSCKTEKIHEPVTIDGFLFDTYIYAKSYSENEEFVPAKMCTSSLTLCEKMDFTFNSVYDTDANKLNDESGYIKDCLQITAELNERYGNDINLTCGRVTSLWGISTEHPTVPSESDILSALQYMEDTAYHNGDLTAFGDGVMLDFGAVAKGYACDMIYEKNRDAFFGRPNYSPANDAYYKQYQIVSMGSTTLLYGEKPDGSKFHTAIRNPDGTDNFLGYINCDQAFISTSGGYERYFIDNGTKYEHILDINTGYPIKTDLTSVSVIIPTSWNEHGGTMSDFMSTLIYIGGTEKLDTYLNDTDFYVITTDNSGHVYKSHHMPEDMFELKATEEYSYAE